MTDTPEDRNNPENESDKPTPEGSSETAADETEVLHDEETFTDGSIRRQR